MAFFPFFFDADELGALKIAREIESCSSASDVFTPELTSQPDTRKGKTPKKKKKACISDVRCRRSSFLKSFFFCSAGPATGIHPL